MVDEFEKKLERELEKYRKNWGALALSQIYEKYAELDDIRTLEYIKKLIPTYDPIPDTNYQKSRNPHFIFLDGLKYEADKFDDREMLELVLDCYIEKVEDGTLEKTALDIYKLCYENQYSLGLKFGLKVLAEFIEQNNLIENAREIDYTSHGTDSNSPELNGPLKKAYCFFKKVGDEPMLAQAQDTLARTVFREGEMLPVKGNMLNGYKGFGMAAVHYRQDAVDTYLFFGARVKDEEGLKLVAEYCKKKADELGETKFNERYEGIYFCLLEIGRKFQDEELMELGREVLNW